MDIFSITEGSPKFLDLRHTGTNEHGKLQSKCGQWAVSGGNMSHFTGKNKEVGISFT